MSLPARRETVREELTQASRAPPVAPLRVVSWPDAPPLGPSQSRLARVGPAR